MGNVLPMYPQRIVSIERAGYSLSVTNDAGEYKVTERGQCIAVYSSMLKALSEFYRRKEAAEVAYAPA